MVLTGLRPFAAPRVVVICVQIQRAPSPSATSDAAESDSGRPFMTSLDGRTNWSATKIARIVVASAERGGVGVERTHRCPAWDPGRGASSVDLVEDARSLRVVDVLRRRGRRAEREGVDAVLDLVLELATGPALPAVGHHALEGVDGGEAG